MDLRWRPSFPASCAHAAAAVASGRDLIDATLAVNLGVTVKELCDAISVAGADPADYLRHFCALAVDIDNNRQLAEMALTKTIGRGQRDQHVAAIGGRIGAIEAAVSSVAPKLAENLALRVPLWREQWEARGPGLLAAFSRLTSPELLVERADVILVEPVTGGGGDAHHAYNSVRIEAVLANPEERLPEIARLAWLLVQLQLDLPKYRERLPGDRWRLLAALAVLPGALTAAQEVELTRGALDDLIGLAISHWRIGSADSAAETARGVAAWWETFRQGGLEWADAVVALEMLLGQ